MKKKLSITLLLFILISSITSCSKIKLSENKYDNMSFYNLYNHNVVEVENGFYAIYKGYAVFIDKKDYKYYLLSNTQTKLEELIKNKEIGEKDISFFGEGSDIFYENNRLYIYSKVDRGLVEYDYKKGVRKKILDIRDSFKNLLKKEKFIYKLGYFDEKDSKEVNQLKLYDLEKKEDKLLIDFIEDYPDLESTSIQKMVYFKDNVILDTIESNKNGVDIDRIYIYNFVKNNVQYLSRFSTINEKQYKINSIYEFNNELYLNYTENSDDWASKKVYVYKLNIDNLTTTKYTEIEPLHQLGSNGKIEYKFPLNIVPIIKTFDEKAKIQQGYKEDIEYKISWENKSIIIPDENFLKTNTIFLMFSNDGYPILKYEDGHIKIVKDREIIDVFK